MLLILPSHTRLDFFNPQIEPDQKWVQSFQYQTIHS